MNKKELDKHFNSSPSWDIPSTKKAKWCLETERDDILLKLNWYANTLREPKLTMPQFLQLARERSQLTVRLDRVKRQIDILKAKNYSIKRLKDKIPNTISIPRGITLGR
jgi:hypothetical protein